MGEAVHPAKSEIWSTDHLLPELADNEVTKCFQYLRKNKDTFQELLALVEPLIARRITKFRFCTVISCNSQHFAAVTMHQILSHSHNDAVTSQLLFIPSIWYMCVWY